MNARFDIGFVPEIEQEVLGTLLGGGSYPVAASILEPNHFVHQAHTLIFEACGKAYEATGSCKLTMARNYMDREALDKLLHPEKSNAYLASIIGNTSFGSSRFVESCQKVVGQWARLAISEEFSVLADAANDVSADVKKIILRCGERSDEIMSFLRRGSNRKTRFTLHEASQNALKASINAREMGTGLTGIDWGLNDVNRLTGGIQKRDLTIMAGRPSMGKTTCIMSAAMHSALRGFCFGFISKEMDAEKVAARQISDIAFDDGLRIPYVDILQGRVPRQQDHALSLAVERLKDIPLYIEDQSNLSMHQIRVKLESLLEQALKDGHTLDCLIVDHLGLIKPSSHYNGNRNNEIGEISAGLKGFAREYDIAVVALSQLSRALESRTDKRPIMSDLRDSGSLEQDADTIIFLYREAYYLERSMEENPKPEDAARLLEVQNDLDFIIAKQRNGAVQTVKLHSQMAYSAVRNAA